MSYFSLSTLFFLSPSFFPTYATHLISYQPLGLASLEEWMIIMTFIRFVPLCSVKSLLQIKLSNVAPKNKRK